MIHGLINIKITNEIIGFSVLRRRLLPCHYLNKKVQKMEAIAAFEFATATRIIFGRGTLAQVGGIVKSFGSRALIVTGKNTERAKPLTTILDKNNISV